MAKVTTQVRYMKWSNARDCIRFRAYVFNMRKKRKMIEEMSLSPRLAAAWSNKFIEQNTAIQTYLDYNAEEQWCRPGHLCEFCNIIKETLRK